MEKGVLAAIRRFPLQGQRIRRLALVDDCFLSVCNDLADAEQVHNRLARLSTPQNPDRRLEEYEALANDLAGEIQNILNNPPTCASSIP